MKSIARLIAQRDILQRAAGISAPVDSHLDSLSRSFHLGRVGGSGPNTASLNRRREASLDRAIDSAVKHVAARKELAWVNAQIRVIEDRPRDLAIKEAVGKIIEERGRTVAASLKPGDMVRWVVSGTNCKVLRVNKSSVTVEMCGGKERLMMNEIQSV